MATFTGTPSLIGTINFVDKHAKVWSKRFALTATDHATALTELTAIATDLKACMNMPIRDITIGWSYQEDGWVGTGAGDGSQQAQITLELSTLNEYVNYWIPSPDPAVVMQATTGKGSTIVNVSASELQTFFAHLQSGGEATISDGEVLKAGNPMITGVLVSRKVRYD